MHVWFLYRALSDPVGNSHSPHMSLTQISWRAGSHACSCSDFDFWKCHIASWRELFFAARNHEQVDLFHGPILSGYFISISPYDLHVWTAALRLFAAIATLHSRVALLCLQCQTDRHCHDFTQGGEASQFSSMDNVCKGKERQQTANTHVHRRGFLSTGTATQPLHAFAVKFLNDLRQANCTWDHTG